jgi:hypothetical protein
MVAEREAATVVETRAAPGRRPVWPSLLLAVVFVVGFLLVSSVVVVRGLLLDAGLYSTALVEADAYERTYTEVLADPELAEATERLLGDVGVDAAGVTQARSLATSSLRLAVPPSTLRRSTEAFVAALLAYVRGDTARLDGDVDVSEVLARVHDSAVAWVQGQLATVRERVAPSVGDYRVAVDRFADDLAAGRVPDAVPVVGGTTVDAEAALGVILDRAGQRLDSRGRDQIRAAVLSGEEREALASAAGYLITERVRESVAGLRARLEDGRELDVVAEVADRAGRSRNAVVGELNTVRDAARWLGLPTAAAGVTLMAGAAAGIVWLNRRHPRRAGYLLAAAAVASGFTILALWAIVSALVDAPLAPATETGQGTWNLPAGLRSLLADIESSLADELVGTIRRLALVPLAVGAALAGGIALAPRLRLPAPRGAVAAGTTAAVVAGLVAWAVPAAAAGGDTRACNGHPELCDRRYDEVAYAATHNSMASPDVVRVWPEHDGNIRAQLDAGVRALLIDTHHWDPLVSGEQLTAAEPYLPPGLAQRLLASLGPLREGRPGTFLCHNQCALGAIPLADALDTISEFLDANPDEVVTLIIQDAISSTETEDAFADAGLDRYLHRHGPDTPWATLGDLIDRGERLVVFAEAEGPPPAWYHQAFEHMRDTPYEFERPEDFTCAANRGDPDAPLLLMNHWISRRGAAPDRATAADVNRAHVLVERARTCQRERGQMVNYVAVDFYGLGDLAGAVDTLNGVR